MLTAFGKFNRKLRIDKGELLKDMAKKLGVTAAYLSAVEVGKRKVPEKWLSELSALYRLTAQEKVEMQSAYDQSRTEVTIDLKDQQPSHREAAMMFARELKNIDEQDIQKLMTKMLKMKRRFE